MQYTGILIVKNRNLIIKNNFFCEYNFSLTSHCHKSILKIITRLFNSSTYINRREQLARHVKTVIIILLGNNESPMNYEDNTCPYRQDSTLLYFFGLNNAKLAATIDCETVKADCMGMILQLKKLSGPDHKKVFLS